MKRRMFAVLATLTVVLGLTFAVPALAPAENVPQAQAATITLGWAYENVYYGGQVNIVTTTYRGNCDRTGYTMSFPVFGNRISSVKANRAASCNSVIVYNRAGASFFKCGGTSYMPTAWNDWVDRINFRYTPGC